MYNKISSITLNSGKANGLSDVFIAQPDALKENLAGKVFIMAEIGGKKTEGRKVFDFLISSLNDNYYNDEKILLRDKIEGLKIENIFEAAISKTNKNLNEFLTEEKIKLTGAVTNLTIGVIYENKLYFSGFGKNRALLIYRHGEQYEIINVEANASDVNSGTEASDHITPRTPALFSSVISGEIPIGSYFVFASEALLEYVSSKDLISIITKLPPIVAAEQIKNILAKINSFIPFLGVIIKNTTGVDNQEIREEVEENLTAHSSISSLNYTEQKTERMLAPAGLISFSKLYKGAQGILRNLQPAPKIIPKKVYRTEEDEKPLSTPIDLGRIKSLNLARADSFLIKEKIFFKKKPSWLSSGFKKIAISLPNLSNSRLWSDFSSTVRSWFSGANIRNRLLIISLTAVTLIFLVSLGITNWTRKQQAATNQYNNLLTTLEEKHNAIESFLMYGNEDGAQKALIDGRALLSSLPKDKEDRLAVYSDLENKFNLQADKIQKVVRIETAEKVNDLSGLKIANIIWASGKIFASGGNMLYGIIPQSSSSTRLEVIGAANLSNPQFDKKKNLLYYLDGNKIAQIDLRANKASLINIIGDFNAAEATSYKIFGGGANGGNLYVLAKAKNQIYLYQRDKSGFKTKSDWLKTPADLGAASDLAIDGNIYVLKNSGEILKFYINKPLDYSAPALAPVMTSANKIIVGTKYIYIFEASSKRLAVLAIKDGHLMNQYYINSLQAQDFAIDEANKTAYFLADEMVYKIKLNQ